MKQGHNEVLNGLKCFDRVSAHFSMRWPQKSVYFSAFATGKVFQRNATPFDSKKMQKISTEALMALHKFTGLPDFSWSKHTKNGKTIPN
jgi:hypothetical protein